MGRAEADFRQGVRQKFEALLLGHGAKLGPGVVALRLRSQITSFALFVPHLHGPSAIRNSHRRWPREAGEEARGENGWRRYARQIAYTSRKPVRAPSHMLARIPRVPSSRRHSPRDETHDIRSENARC